MAVSKEHALSKKTEIAEFDSPEEANIDRFLLERYRGIALAVPAELVDCMEDHTKGILLHKYHQLGWKFMRFADERGKFVIFH